MSKPFVAHFRKGLRFTEVDPELVTFIRNKLKEGAIPTSIVPAEVQHFAAIGNYQPATRTTLPMALGYVQAPFIGSELLPEFVGGADEQASYPTFGFEKFYAAGDAVAMAGELQESDVTVTWTTVALDVYGKKAYVDRRERSAAVTLPIGIDAYKMAVIETQVKTQKEKAQADFMRSTGNYLSSTYYSTLSGSTQWSHASGVPITDVVTKSDVIRQAVRVSPDVFWTGERGLQALRRNAQVIESVKYTGTRGLPGNMVPIDTLVALFGKTIVIGGAGGTTTPGGTSATDLWDDDAGLVCTGLSQVEAVRFGITVGSAGYPNIRTFPDENRGAKGSDAMTYSDAWKLKSIKNTAAYLWADVTA